jgi:hypothetical protein
MKHYPAKSTKRKVKSEEDLFDKSQLTALDLELLADFKTRREVYDRQIAGSNIIHTKETCSACGFPTFEKDDYFATCIICLWEGMSSDKNDTLRSVPNYSSLMEHRIAVSGFLRSFLENNEIDPSVDEVIKSINRFLEGDIPVDRENLDNNLKNILSTSPEK